GQEKLHFGIEPLGRDVRHGRDGAEVHAPISEIVHHVLITAGRHDCNFRVGRSPEVVEKGLVKATDVVNGLAALPGWHSKSIQGLGVGDFAGGRTGEADEHHRYPTACRAHRALLAQGISESASLVARESLLPFSEGLAYFSRWLSVAYYHENRAEGKL